jgi:hypothetical protein
MNSLFFIHQIILVVLLLGFYYVTGKKIKHFAFFFLPFIFDTLFVDQKSISTLTHLASLSSRSWNGAGLLTKGGSSL